MRNKSSLKGPVSGITSKYSADIYYIARQDDGRKFLTLNWQCYTAQNFNLYGSFRNNYLWIKAKVSRQDFERQTEVK
jgi:hypothetical protein